MDIDQLKLVLETIQSVSHDASSLAILWLWLKFGAVAFSHLFWGTIVVSAVWLIVRLIRQQTDGEKYEQFLRDMRDTLGTGTGGVLTPEEFSRTSAKLRELADAYRNNKGK